MKNNIRRPKALEVMTAMCWALLTYIDGRKEVEPSRKEMMGFLQGQFRDDFLKRLNGSLNHKGEYAMFDNEHGLLIKKIEA